MGLSSADYLRLLQALLPPGSAWPREASAILTRTLSGLSGELSRLDARVDDLMNEIDPRLALDLLTDWERVCSLSAGDLPVDKRRDAVAMLLSAVGGSSLKYFQDIADATMGVGSVTITEGPEPYVWRVRFNSITTTHFTAGDSSSGDLLDDWPANPYTLGVFERIKPAHTRLIFSYT
jgi:uncharacterized protein YmfQ (DUF2313 family)